MTVSRGKQGSISTRPTRGVTRVPSASTPGAGTIGPTVCQATRALAGLKVRSAVIDGEAIVVGEDGLSDFFTLHAALARKSAPRAVLVAFDLMHLDGEDMRGRVL